MKLTSCVSKEGGHYVNTRSFEKGKQLSIGFFQRARVGATNFWPQNFLSVPRVLMFYLYLYLFQQVHTHHVL